ncbi:hypothetical protein NM208_g16856 [Fusarium decemcellulare]|uniref:Uncharacterized protein n=1 Tax=Fusarium decemcellulare TaxID=57161 RepID=A0ACC1RA80_9HYPO|nr:hypothetical protein NM208_g16856 [Fusarium decemcellulare]
MLVHDGAVPHADLVHVGRGPELFALKRRHRGALGAEGEDGFGRAEGPRGRELRERHGAEDEALSVEGEDKISEAGDCGSRLVAGGVEQPSSGSNISTWNNGLSENNSINDTLTESTITDHFTLINSLFSLMKPEHTGPCTNGANARQRCLMYRLVPRQTTCPGPSCQANPMIHVPEGQHDPVPGARTLKMSGISWGTLSCWGLESRVTASSLDMSASPPLRIIMLRAPVLAPSHVLRIGLNARGKKFLQPGTLPELWIPVATALLTAVTQCELAGLDPLVHASPEI